MIFSTSPLDQRRPTTEKYLRSAQVKIVGGLWTSLIPPLPLPSSFSPSAPVPFESPHQRTETVVGLFGPSIYMVLLAFGAMATPGVGIGGSMLAVLPRPSRSTHMRRPMHC